MIRRTTVWDASSGARCIASVGLMIVLLAVAGACNWGRQSSERSVSEVWARPSPATTQASAAPPNPRASAPPAEATGPPRPPLKPIAYVNGDPIGREQVVSILLDGYGLGVLQQQIVLAAVKQAAAAAGVSVNGADIEREYDLTIQAAHLDGNGPETLTPIRRAELIELWLKRTGVSAGELRMAMQRQAYLRKMVASRVSVSEEAIRAEYERQFGEKVEVRHIQLRSLREFDQLYPRLRAGEDFAALAARFSQNAETVREGGLLPPFSVKDPRFPATLREAAFRLKPGEFSNPIQYDNAYHVLRVERRIPAVDKPLESVRVELIRSVEAQRTAEEMDKLAVETLMRAGVRIVDDKLRERYLRERAAGRITGPSLQP